MTTPAFERDRSSAKFRLASSCQDENRICEKGEENDVGAADEDGRGRRESRTKELHASSVPSS